MAPLALDRVPAGQLAGRWGVPRVTLVRQLPSTLDAIHALGAEGAAEGTAVIAEEQTAGRGRNGRMWHSPLGGVWLAMLFRPHAEQVELGAVSIRAGLALADVLDALLGAPLTRLKWPNDVLLDDRKLAGILSEARWQGSRLQWFALGLGVNVRNVIPAAVARSAIALAERLPAVRRIDVLDPLVPALAQLTASAAALSERECAAFAARDWLRGRQIRSPAEGLARGLRPDGALLVDRGVGTIGVREGHVELA